MCLIYLMVNGDRLPFLFGFDDLSVFGGGKVSLLSTSSSFMYSSISPLLIFHIFLALRPLFLTSPHHVSTGPPIRNETLHMLYYIYGRYGGAGRGRGGFVMFLPFHFITRWGAGKVGIYLCLSALPFFAKLERHEIFLWHYVCVR